MYYTSVDVLVPPPPNPGGSTLPGKLVVGYYLQNIPLIQ